MPAQVHITHTMNPARQRTARRWTNLGELPSHPLRHFPPHWFSRPEPWAADAWWALGVWLAPGLAPRSAQASCSGPGGCCGSFAGFRESPLGKDTLHCPLRSHGTSAFCASAKLEKKVVSLFALSTSPPANRHEGLLRSKLSKRWYEWESHNVYCIGWLWINTPQWLCSEERTKNKQKKHRQIVTTHRDHLEIVNTKVHLPVHVEGTWTLLSSLQWRLMADLHSWFHCIFSADPARPQPNASNYQNLPSVIFNCSLSSFSESNTWEALFLSFFFFFFFAVPSSVPTSEAQFLHRSSWHPPPLATPRAHSTSRPHPMRPTRGDVRSLGGCQPKETLHCCWVTSVVFSSACSNWTYAGHHLLCPLLTTMLARSRSQTEWASPQRADCHYVPPPILLCGLSDVEGFDQNCLRQGRMEETENEATTRSWHKGLQKLRLFIYAVIDEDENWGSMEVHFRFETTWQGRRPCLLS